LIAIERFHPMISSNILPNILPKKFISLLSEKPLKKKTLLHRITDISTQLKKSQCARKCGVQN
jgi:hypothetical protein